MSLVSSSSAHHRAARCARVLARRHNHKARYKAASLMLSCRTLYTGKPRIPIFISGQAVIGPGQQAGREFALMHKLDMHVVLVSHLYPGGAPGGDSDKHFIEAPQRHPRCMHSTGTRHSLHARKPN